jgi:hypothetical protein
MRPRTVGRGAPAWLLTANLPAKITCHRLMQQTLAGLDVIAPHVVIQPPGERAAGATGAQATDQIRGAQIDPRMGGDHTEASAESTLRGFDHPTSTFGAVHRAHHQTAIDAREAPELETGA